MKLFCSSFGIALLLVASVYAEYEVNVEIEETVEPFAGRCYECNSVYHDNCAEIHMENSKQYLVDCNTRKYKPTTNNFPDDITPKACRKIQTVQKAAFLLLGRQSTQHVFTDC